MFDKYIAIGRKKSFYKSFIILLIMSCVAHSYNFQIFLAREDIDFMNNFNSFSRFDSITGFMASDPRFIRNIISALFSDAMAAKNAMLFLNLVITSWLTVFYIRVGFGVQSIFWSVLLSSVLTLNVAMSHHYMLAMCLNYFSVSFFALSLFAGVIVNNERRSIITTSLLMFLCISVYQPNAVQYIIAVMAIVSVNLLRDQDLELKELFLNQLKNKIIPAIMSLLGGLVLHVGISELFLKNHNNRMYQALGSGQPFQDIGHNLHIILDRLIYRLYTGTLHNDKIVFMLLLLSALIGVFVIVKKQGMFKASIITASITGLIFISPFIINFRSLYNSDGMGDMLTFSVPYGVIMALLVYFIYTAFSELKYLKNIVAVGLFIFTLQLINAMVHQGFVVLQSQNARNATINRLFVDLHNFAHKHNISGKPVVYFYYLGWQDSQKVIYGADVFHSKHKYLHYNNYLDSFYLNYVFLPQYIYALGAESDFLIYQNRDKAIQVCNNNIEKMQRWPFLNSMKLIDGVIYVKMDEYPKSVLCDRNLNNIQNQPYSALPDGLYNIGKW